MCTYSMCVLTFTPVYVLLCTYIVGSGDGAPEQWGPEAATHKTTAKVRKSGLHVVLASYTFSK